MSRVCLLSIALACALALPAAAGEARVAFGRYALRGPLETFELDGGRAGTARFELELAAGETLELELAVPVLTEPGPGFPAPAPPVGSLPAGAEVRFEGWDGPRATRMREGWRRVPRGLRARTRPPVAERERGSGRFELALLAAAGLLGLGLRRRPWAALCVGAAAAAVLLARDANVTRGVTLGVLEGELGADWIEVRAGWGEARLGPRAGDPELLRVETEPADAPLLVRGDLGRGGAQLSVTAEAALFLTRETGFPRSFRDAASVAGWLWQAGVPDPEAGQDFLVETLRGAWYRTAQGAWSRWELTGVQSAPPGWLASGLPQGVGVLLLEGTRGRYLRQTRLSGPPLWFQAQSVGPGNPSAPSDSREGKPAGD